MAAARLATFGKTNAWWPHPLAKKSGWLTTPMSLSKAGFTFTPNADSPDCATCFYCDTSLDGWECVDEPWAQHEKRAPDCPFFLARLEEEEVQDEEEVAEEVKPTAKRATKPLKSTASRKTATSSTKSGAASRSKKARNLPEAPVGETVDASAGETEVETEAEGEGVIMVAAPGPSASGSSSDAVVSTKRNAMKGSPTDGVDSDGPHSLPLIMVSPAKKATRGRKAVNGGATASTGGKSKARITASKASSVVESEAEDIHEDTDAELPQIVAEIAVPQPIAEPSLPPAQREDTPPRRPARAGKKAAQNFPDAVSTVSNDHAHPIPPTAAPDTIGLGRPPPQKAPARVTRKASAALSASTSTALSVSTNSRMHSRTTSAASVVSATSAATSTSDQQAPVSKATAAISQNPVPAAAVPKAGSRAKSKTSTAISDIPPPNITKPSLTSVKPVRAPVPRNKKGSSIPAATSSASVVDSTPAAEGVDYETAEASTPEEIDHTIEQQQEDEIQQIRADSRRLGAREARAVMENLDTLTPRVGKTEEQGKRAAVPSRSESQVIPGTDAEMAEMSVLEYIRSIYLQKFTELKEDGERMVGAWEERVKLERRRIEAIPSHQVDV